MSRRQDRSEHFHGYHRQFKPVPERGWAWERMQELERSRQETRVFLRWVAGIVVFGVFLYSLVYLAS